MNDELRRKSQDEIKFVVYNKTKIKGVIIHKAGEKKLIIHS